MRAVQASLFWMLSRVGRPFGGVRPRRVTEWLAVRAFEPPGAGEAGFAWYRDRWGSRLYLHPFYLMDRAVIACGAYEPALHRLIRRTVRPGMICLDVGANIGMITVTLGRAVGPSGHVHAFEPAPTQVERLRLHLTRNGLESIVTIHETAVSDREGPVTLSYAPTDTRNQGRGSTVTGTDPDVTLTRTVESTTLDAFVEGQGLDRVDLIKVDIQGAEPLFLEGGARTLSGLSPDLIMEVSPLDLAPLGLDSRDLLGMLEARGYSLFAVRPDGRLGQPIVAGEVAGDFTAGCLFCTKKTRESEGTRGDRPPS